MKRKNIYKNLKWINFSEEVKKRDKYSCVKCQRNQSEVILQVHHNTYRKKKKIWEYGLSDCETLCKGCHRREHGILEPSEGWVLIDINDLGDKIGMCERYKCETSIRYENYIYHPSWGYITVGSTCVDYLTEVEREFCKNTRKIYEKVSKFLNIKDSEWYKRKNKKENLNYKAINYDKRTKIAIYSRKENKNKNYSFNIFINKEWVFKKPWETKFQYGDIERVKEMALLQLLHRKSRKKEIIKTIEKIWDNMSLDDYLILKEKKRKD